MWQESFGSLVYCIQSTNVFYQSCCLHDYVIFKFSDSTKLICISHKHTYSLENHYAFIPSYKAVTDSPVGQVLARPLFLKVKA